MSFFVLTGLFVSAGEAQAKAPRTEALQAAKAAEVIDILKDGVTKVSYTVGERQNTLGVGDVVVVPPLAEMSFLDPLLVERAFDMTYFHQDLRYFLTRPL